MEHLEKENSKIVLQVDRGQENGTEIDLINVFEFMGKKKKLVAYLLIMSILVGSFFGFIYCGYEHFSGEGSYARALITFQFKGIEKGLDPNGASFDVTQIKSPYVIQQALDELGLEENVIENIRQNIVIQGVIPEDAIERITTINKMAEKDAENYEKLLDVSYFPSQYLIYLYDDGTFNSKELAQVLNTIIASYRQYFLDTYANTEVMSVTSNLLNGEDYDYAEAVDLVNTQISTMLSYVREKRNEAPDFRAASTGLSFDDIVTALQFVRTVDVAKLNSYVTQRALTRDRERQIEYYDYRIRMASNELSEYQTQLEAVNNTIAAYEKDPVVVVSGSDSTLEYGEKNEYYDSLVNRKLSLTQSIAEANTRLNEYYIYYNNLMDSERVFTQADFDYADNIITNLDSTIKEWVGLVEKTTEEYYSTTLFSNAVKITVPAKYVVDGGIVHIVINLMIPSGVLILLVLIWWFGNGLKAEIARMRAKEEEKFEE